LQAQCTINYIAGSCRPDISFAAKELCRNLSNPSHADFKAAKRVAQYLYTTRNEGLNFDNRRSPTPVRFADADFANQLSNRRSTTGRVIMWYGSAVCWASKQQRTVALSTAEAEYYALGDLARDVVWFRQLASDLGVTITDPTLLNEDSRSAIKWASDSASWSKTRHIAVQYHKIREWISQNIVRVEHCPTNEQLADSLTKALPVHQHQKLKRHVLNEPIIEHLSKNTSAAA
jgi:hypothetical protein